MEPVQPLCVLTAFQTQFEAEHMRLVLEAAGIEAYIEGLHGSSNFTFNTLVGVIRIMVAANDMERAQQVLSEADQQQGSDWYCGECKEFSDASFDICWRCGQSRSEVEAEPSLPEPAEPNRSASADALQPVSLDHSAFSYRPSPYATPQSPASRSSSREVNPLDADELEDTVNRAWRASIIGLGLLPVVTQIYSLVLLLGALSIPAPLHGRTRSRFFVAMAVNLTVFLAFMIFIGAVMPRRP